jgi:hypothetical protein
MRLELLKDCPVEAAGHTFTLLVEVVDGLYQQQIRIDDEVFVPNNDHMFMWKGTRVRVNPFTTTYVGLDIEKRHKVAVM